ncbi:MULTISPECIES: rhomboid family intramembrane serine protease [Sphingomonadales]|uniref:Rhomboid family intramembrane serine protease n=2 Tax=Edaphosphingomonas TaxID=3423724 RepID=A0A2T4I4N6_9SPHN|nr:MULTISPECIES: rhomboid family intramembrane serine protease [Sphingomonas]AGH47868.1 Rhomboid family protein [Sphingomonas sp. MM-1]OHT20269.1 Rhomboid family protein [Sphingomonas haloaromaticamans]PTD24461.1 rhomboid family intramembrane serine protease [Sphingomonas fennica]
MQLPPARATLAILGVTIASWLLVSWSGLGDIAAYAGGFIPARFSIGGVAPTLEMSVRGIPFAPRWLTPLTATLLHGGFIHIAFNMLILGLCGRFVEAAIGARGIVILYVVGAYVAAFGHFLAGPTEPWPMIGASGAVSAVIGAYALLYGEKRRTFANRRLNQLANALWLAAAWVLLQLMVGLASWGGSGGGGIAIAAHIGGFFAGLALAQPLLLLRYRRA